MTPTCPACGVKVEAEDSYCWDCGGSLEKHRLNVSPVVEVVPEGVSEQIVKPKKTKRKRPDTSHIQIGWVVAISCFVIGTILVSLLLFPQEMVNFVATLPTVFGDALGNFGTETIWFITDVIDIMTSIPAVIYIIAIIGVISILLGILAKKLLAQARR